MQVSRKINYEETLEKFGLSSFRPGQKEVIDSLINGHDCLCVMPTGGGKSLCYQLPAVLRPGLTIVVSPLIALMKDQVDTLMRRGIKATVINSTLTLSEQNDRLHLVASGEYKLLYIAPERLRNQQFMEAIRATPVQLLAIDEAHCISEWGHDFRPDYAKIGRFREFLGNIQTIALTATATARVRQDIMDVLRLSNPKQYITGFARTNLHFGVQQYHSDRDKSSDIVDFLNRRPGSGIIYAATRKRCEELVETIKQQTRAKVGAYHAGLEANERRMIHEQFMSGKLEAIVATNAFGMGIDKADLRFVIHNNMPGSLEAYYQEAGRAGRDGKNSQCILQYSTQDRFIHEFFIDNNYPPPEMVKTVYEFLQSRTEDPIELTQQEIREHLNLPQSAEAVGSALHILGKTRVLDRLEMSGGLAMLRIQSDLPTLVDLLPRDAKSQRTVLRAVENAVGSRRFEPVYIHPRILLQRTGMQREAIQRALRELCKLEAFDYVPPFKGRAIHFRQLGKKFEELEIDFDLLMDRKKAELAKLDQVIAFAKASSCRQRVILDYFGDPNADDCGICDRCLSTTAWECGKLEIGAQPTIDSIPVGAGHQQSSDSDDALNSEESVQAGIGATEQRQLCQRRQEFYLSILRALEKLHGRLGRILSSQYLCGSENAKVQRLRLHRLADFGLLKQFNQPETNQILVSFLSENILQQTEVNKHRPTLSLTEFGTHILNRQADFPYSLHFKPKLEAKLTKLYGPAYARVEKPSVVEQPKPVAKVPKTEIPEPEPPSPSLEANKQRKDSMGSIDFVPAPHFEIPAVAVNTNLDSEPKDDRELVDHESQIPGEESIDWKWTWRLASDGYSLSECAAIRRLSPEVCLQHLHQSLEHGKTFALSHVLTAEQVRQIVPMLRNELPKSPPPEFSSPKSLWRLIEAFAKQRSVSQHS